MRETEREEEEGEAGYAGFTEYGRSMDAVTIIVTNLFSFLLVCPIPTREQTTCDTV